MLHYITLFSFWGRLHLIAWGDLIPCPRASDYCLKEITPMVNNVKFSNSKIWHIGKNWKKYIFLQIYKITREILDNDWFVWTGSLIQYGLKISCELPQSFRGLLEWTYVSASKFFGCRDQTNQQPKVSKAYRKIWKSWCWFW